MNLAVGDLIRAEWFLRDTMDTTSDLSKLMRKSPKQDAMLFKLKEELSFENPGFRVTCPTRRTMRTESLKSVLRWNNSLEEKIDPAIRGRIIGVQSQKHCVDYYFGIYVLQLLLRCSDSLQKHPKILKCRHVKIKR